MADISDMGLISKIYFKNLQNSTHTHTHTQNRTFKKWSKDLNRHFSKENVRMANRHLKRCSMSLIIREMQIKTTVRYHLTPVRMAIINKSTNDSVGEDVKKR